MADFERSVDWIVATFPANAPAVGAGSVAFLMLAGYVAGGWMMARSAIAAAKGEGDPAFLAGKRLTARFYADLLLTRTSGLAESVVAGAGSVIAAEDAMF